MELNTLPVYLITILLLISATVAMAVKWIRVPYSIALVIVGLVIGICGLLPSVRMTPELILLVCLPALLFEASWNLDINQAKENGLAISILATVGVVGSAFIVGVVLNVWGKVSLATALLFGAITSATDPVSVLGIFRRLRINKRLSSILEGESLFNDGTAVALFQLLLFMVLTGTTYSIPETVAKFSVVILGGMLVGAGVGFIATKVIAEFDDHLLELMLTTVVAYGAFLLAEEINTSSVLAVVLAGMVLGNAGGKSSMSRTTRVAVDSFWEYAAFVVSSLLFLLLGLQIQLPLLAKYGSQIGIAIVALLISRFIVVYLLSPWLSSKKVPISAAWRPILFWGALRGSLSMAMALSLPLNFPAREQLVVLTFGVVLFTLLVQGLTVEPLIKMLARKNPDLLSVPSSKRAQLKA